MSSPRRIEKIFKGCTINNNMACDSLINILAFKTMGTFSCFVLHLGLTRLIKVFVIFAFTKMYPSNHLHFHH